MKRDARRGLPGRGGESHPQIAQRSADLTAILGILDHHVHVLGPRLRLATSLPLERGAHLGRQVRLRQSHLASRLGQPEGHLPLAALEVRPHVADPAEASQLAASASASFESTSRSGPRSATSTARPAGPVWGCAIS